MDNTALDVLVIGAGTAGLAAARALSSRGRKALILEARDRVGGRILSIHDALSPVPVELGAEFVHGRSPLLWNVLQGANLPVVESQGEQWAPGENGIHPAEDFEAVGRVFEAMANAPERAFPDQSSPDQSFPDRSFEEFLRGTEFDAKTKAAAIRFVEGFNAARQERVSVEWLTFENGQGDRIEADRAFRVLSGYDGVPRHLASGLEIRLATPVRRIRWQPGEVTAETLAGEIHAKQAIVTVPFGVLQNSLEIDPEPRNLSAARGAIEVGHAIRVAFRFRKISWEPERLSFLMGGEAPFAVWWTQYPVVAPLITGWAAGSKAENMLGFEKGDVEQIALESLRGMLGSSLPDPERIYSYDWSRDPYARGAYTYVRVGGWKTQQALHHGVENTLFFAGEAADVSGHVGTVHGALASGILAAELAG